MEGIVNLPIIYKHIECNGKAFEKCKLCDECASKHECGEEMLLPVVNSPRVGMCGYTG